MRAAEKFRLDDLLEEFIDDYNEAPVKDAFIEHVILKQMKVHMWDGTPKAGYPYEPRTDELCKRIGQRMRDLRKKRKAAETALIEGAIEGAKKSKSTYVCTGRRWWLLLQQLILFCVCFLFSLTCMFY